MLPLISVSYLASELVGVSFAPFDLFDWVTRVLPGSVVTFGIDLMIDVIGVFGAGISDTAKSAERAIALIQLVVAGAAFGAIYSGFTQNYERRQALISAAGIGAFVGFLMALISSSIGGYSTNGTVAVLWSMVLFAGWATAVGFVQLRLESGRSADISEAEAEAEARPEAEFDQSLTKVGRREFVIKVGASVAVLTVASTSVGSLLANAARRELEASVKATSGASSAAPVAVEASAVAAGIPAEAPIPAIDLLPFTNVDDPVTAAPGTRPEYTDTKDHYDISLRTRATEIDGSEWTLDITGLVPEPVSFSIADLRRDFEAHNRFVTLSCISGPVGSRLMSTTQWTGLSVQDLLDRIQPFENARYLDFTCADGFHEVVDIRHIQDDERIMLCYAWNGEPLPIDHGFPLRIWLPDRYGMKQPRWIESIEITDKYREGYWVKRGWDAVARIQPTSAVDIVSKDDVYEVDGQSFVPVGGIAFAGTRGISKVEVRIDQGPWQLADLRAPLSDSTWTVWRYDWPFEAGLHEFEVRCVTGDGAPQEEDNRDVHPSGATGIHSIKRRLEST